MTAPGTVTECIHGLELEMCDICTPRPSGDSRPPASATRTRSAPSERRRAAGLSSIRQTETARVSPGPSVRRTGGDRVYLTVELEELVAALGSAEDAEDAEWRTEPPEGVLPGRVVVVALDSLEPQLIAVPNEPARRAVRDAVATDRSELRIVIQPNWFAH